MGVRVRQKVKGKGNPWWVFISHNGQRASRKVGDKKAAESVASEIRAKIQLGEFGFEKQKPVLTFKEYADLWIKTTVPETCEASTLEDYEAILRNHVLPVFGNLKITDITRGKIKSFLLEKLNNGKAVSTVKHFRNCLSGVFNIIIDDEKMQSNPAKQLGRNFFKTKDIKADIDPLMSEELKLLLDTVSEHFPEHFTLFLLLARTGMRIGEALALQWNDLNFDERFIDVKRSYSKGRISTPKSGEIRRVDMSLQLAETLKFHKKGFVLDLASQKIVQYLFTGEAGNLINITNWRRRVFYKCLEKAELRQIRIHDLRHTYATLRISKGDNIADVSNQLGHHSVKFTWDVYYHWMPGKKKSEVDALDDPSLMRPSAPQVHPGSKKPKKGLPKIG